jgi:hypothetical protein
MRGEAAAGAASEEEVVNWGRRLKMKAASAVQRENPV